MSALTDRTKGHPMYKNNDALVAHAEKIVRAIPLYLTGLVGHGGRLIPCEQLQTFLEDWVRSLRRREHAYQCWINAVEEGRDADRQAKQVIETLRNRISGQYGANREVEDAFGLHPRSYERRKLTPQERKQRAARCAATRHRNRQAKLQAGSSGTKEGQ
jgi:hypothetical protein